MDSGVLLGFQITLHFRTTFIERESLCTLTYSQMIRARGKSGQSLSQFYTKQTLTLMFYLFPSNLLRKTSNTGDCCHMRRLNDLQKSRLSYLNVKYLQKTCSKQLCLSTLFHKTYENIYLMTI